MGWKRSVAGRLGQVSLLLVTGVVGVVGAAAGQVRQRAVEEVMPGVFVRGRSANVVIDADSSPCTPACASGQSCASICRERECEPPDPSARCLRCTRECVE